MSAHDLPPLATVEDLAAWTGEAIDSGDTQAAAFLSGASGLVRSHTGRTWVDDEGALEEVPADVAAVVVQVAARLWRNPGGYIQDTTGPFTVRLPERAGDGLYLTAAEEAILDRYRKGRPAVWALGTTRGPVETGTVRIPRSTRPLLARDDL